MNGRPQSKQKKHRPTRGLALTFLLVLLSILYVSVFLYGNSRSASQLLSSILDGVLPGQLTFGEIRLSPDLHHVDVFQVEIWHPRRDGMAHQPVITADEVHSGINPLALLNGEIVMPRAEVIRPDVYIPIDDKGWVGIVGVWDVQSWDPRDPSSPAPTIRINRATIHDGRTLVHIADGVSVYTEGIEVRNGGFALVETIPFIEGDVTIRSGRVVVMPEVLELTEPRRELALRHYRNLRRVDPWGAVELDALADAATDVGDGFGPLVIPFNNFSGRDFSWEDEGFSIAAVTMELGGDPLEVRGRMTVSDDKLEQIVFGMRGALALSPSSPLLTYFFDDAIAPIDGETAAGSLEFDLHGSLAALAGEMRLQVAQWQLEDWPVDNLTLEIATALSEPFVLSGDALRAEVDEGVVTATGFFDPNDGTYALDLWADQLPSNWLLEPLMSDTDPMALNGTLSTTPSRPGAESRVGMTVRGDLDSKDLGDFVVSRFRHPDQHGQQALVEAEFEQLRWNRGSRAIVPARTIDLMGRIWLTDNGFLHLGDVRGGSSLAVRLDEDRLTIAGALDLLTERLVATRVTGSVASLSNLLDTRSIDGRADTSLLLSGPLDKPEFSVNRLTLRDIDLDGVLVRSIAASGDLAIDGGSPLLRDGRLTASGIELESFSINEVSTDLHFRGDWLEIGDATIGTDFGNLQVDGRVRLFDDGVDRSSNPGLDLAVRSDALDLAEFLPDQPLAGSAEIDVAVNGSMNNPRVQGSVSMSDVIVFDQALDSASADIVYSDNGAQISNIAIESLGGVLSGFMNLNPDGSLDSARARLLALRLEDITALSDLPIQLGGETDIFLEVISPNDIVHPLYVPFEIPGIRPYPGYVDVQGSIIVRDLVVAGAEQGAIAFTVDTYGDAVVAIGQIARILDTRVTWPLDDGVPIELSAHFNRVDLPLVIPSFEEIFQRGEANGGELSAELRLGDEFDLVADLSLAELWLELGGRRFETARPIHVTYAERPADRADTSRHLVVDEFTFGSEGHFLEVSGDVREWRDIDLDIRGEAPISLAQILGDVMADASGLAEITMHLGGTLDDPVPSGEVVFLGASLTPRGLGDDVIVDRGRVLLTEQEEDTDRDSLVQFVQIDERQPITGTLFDGNFELRGQLALDHFMPFALDLSLLATAPSFSLPNEATITFSLMDLFLFARDLDTDEESPFYLSGNLDVEEVVYFKDFGSEASVTSTVVGLIRSQVERYVDPIWRRIPEITQLQFDLNIFAADGVYIRNRSVGAQVDVELRVDVHLGGTIREPRLVGQVGVIDGEIVFQNRTFVVQNCSVEFDGRVTPDNTPVATINNCVSETSIQPSRRASQDRSFTSGIEDEFATDDTTPNNYIVRVTVDGQLPDQIDFTLECINESLDQRDILALIFTGQTFDQLTTGSAGGPSFELVVREFVSLLEADLRERFAIDELIVSPSLQGGGTTIQVADQISRRLTVEAGATVLGEEQNQQNVRGQITLFDWMMLEVWGRSDYENNIQAGGRIRLRLEL